MDKMNRRDFLKWAGKVTASLAVIWAIAPDLSSDEPSMIEPEVLVSPGEPYIWNPECYPYFWRGGMAFRE